MPKRITEEAGRDDTFTLEELWNLAARAYAAGARGDSLVYASIPLFSMNNQKCQLRKMFVEVDS